MSFNIYNGKEHEKMCVCLCVCVCVCVCVCMGFSGGSESKESACNEETWVQSPGQKDLLEKGMATHSSILAWKIPCPDNPGGLVILIYI